VKIVIVGGGLVGDALAGYLSQEGHDIVVVDSSQEVIENTVNKYDVNGVCGNGGIKEILETAGADKADIVIAVSYFDELNILCCQISKLIGAKHTIARVRAPDYVGQVEFMKKKLGISMIVNPEQEAAAEIAQLLKYPTANKVEHFAKGKIGIVEIDIEDDSLLKNIKIKELPNIFSQPLLICAIRRGGNVIIPSGGTEILVGDTVSIVSTSVNLVAFFKRINMFRQRAKSLMIIGGGGTAFYLAKQLAEVGVSVKIIEESMDRCIELSNQLSGVNVICGNGSDRQVLEDEGVSSMDAIAVMTESDEQNIVISMYCKQAGKHQVVTKISNDGYKGLLDAVDLDSVISPHQVTAAQIIRYARAISSPKHDTIITLYKIANEQAEALEFEVSAKFKYIGYKVKDIKLRQNLLLVGIIRGQQTIIPDGETTINLDDHIIVVVANQKLTAIEDILRQ